MSGMATIHGNVDSMVKELESAQKGSDKLAKKGGKANAAKVDTANQKLTTAQQEWDTQSPFIFEKLQSVDESRLNHMRDVLTQALTHEADQLEKCRITTEAALGSMLEVDTATEIKNFSTNTTKGLAKVERSSMQRTISGAGSTAPSTVAPATRPSADDQASMHSNRNDLGQGTTPYNDPFARFGAEPVAEKEAKGLKRFGTMLKGRRQSTQPGSLGRTPSPTKGYGSFGRASNSRDGRPSPSPRASSNNLRGSASDNRLGSLAEDSPVANGTNGVQDNRLIADMIADGSVPSNYNGNSKPLPDLSNVQAPPGPPPSQLDQSRNVVSLSQYNNATADLAKLDAEGFSVPAARNDPISMAQMEASQAAADNAFKVNIKNEPIREEDADAQAALSNVSNTLRMAPPSRKQGTVRGRRDVRNTMYIPPPETSEIRSPDSIVPASPGIPVSVGGGRAAALAALSSDQTASDAGSIRSSRSLGNSAGLKHPDMIGPGLNSSIIETVSATIEDGEVKSASVIGEIALVHGYDQSSPMASSGMYIKLNACLTNDVVGTDTIRLSNFQLLEAIAPNHAFANELSADKPGEYTIDLSQLAKPTVAFRYKVHIDTDNLASQAPTIIKPAWRPQDDKLGLVIEYGLNPAFSTTPITLTNFVILASYEGGKAAGCQTKPTGTHLKEKSLIYWRIGDVTLDTTMQKVIGRLVGAEGAQLKAGTIEVKWEYNSPVGAGGSSLGVSRLDNGRKEEVDPFADDSVAATPSGSSWAEVKSVRKLISGKYDAKHNV